MVPGQPRGYITHNRGGRGINKSVLLYWSWLKFVRECAENAGIELPLEADKQNQAWIRTKAFFKNGVHSDPENCHKAIKDALFYKAKSGDKFTGGTYWGPMYDKENPRIIVNIDPGPNQDISISPNSKGKNDNPRKRRKRN